MQLPILIFGGTADACGVEFLKMQDMKTISFYLALHDWFISTDLHLYERHKKHSMITDH